ncbi:MAG: glutamate--tRNA ligase [Bdellovibrionaceae bacterium]|nr:glutamate--tRNA ligase [Pseudobdellovibrionaceae bacterium]
MSSSWQKINPTVRTRFAPSPTGYLHVGGARTALYNWMYARKLGGEFILRIEDTDEARSTEDSLIGLIRDMVWLGLHWDEGPDPETLLDRGPCAPYRQSRRQHIYKEVAEKLLADGRAYYCFLSDEEIERQREQAQAEGRPPHVQSPYESWPLSQAREHLARGHRAVVRFKTKNLRKDYILRDLIRGEVKFPSDMVGDFVLLRSDGMPVYNFCCVVDDHLMRITHVLRAEEHLSNTLRQMMIYEAMGWPMPEFGHVSLVLDDDRQKLSKRKGAVACGQLKEQGYLPMAVKNFVAMLGWSHPEGKEILNQEEMTQAFSLERLNPAGAVFDRAKFKWVNAMHLRALPDQELWQLTAPFLRSAGLKLPDDPKWQLKSIAVFKTSMETLADAVELYRPLDDGSFKIQEESQEVLSWDSTKSVLSSWIELLNSDPSEYLNENEFLKIQEEVKNRTGAKGKNLFQPIRVAVIGKPQGPELKILVPLISKKSLIRRAQQALAQAGA